MSAARYIDDPERRARLVARHHLGDGPADADSVVADLLALHSSDPLTPYLSLRARVGGFRCDDLDGALLRDRTLWRLHAMRGTLWIATLDDAAVMRAAVAADVAAAERRRLTAWVGEATGRVRVDRWLRSVEGNTLAAMAEGEELRPDILSERVPELATEIATGSGRWARTVPLASRLLSLMAMEGQLVRTRPAGSWRSSTYAWVRSDLWFSTAEPPAPEVARARLVERYVARFGPVTEDDVRWWTGLGVRAVRAALAAVETEVVGLEGGREGHVAVGDAAEGVPAVHPVVAMLPGLDPTAMGWRHRAWYLGPHRGALFDRNGNVGPTIWCDGRIVGGWAQRDGGTVATRLLEDVGAEAAGLVADEAGRLEEWLGGVRTTPRFRTPLERELAG